MSKKSGFFFQLQQKIRRSLDGSFALAGADYYLYYYYMYMFIEGRELKKTFDNTVANEFSVRKETSSDDPRKTGDRPQNIHIKYVLPKLLFFNIMSRSTTANERPGKYRPTTTDDQKIAMEQRITPGHPPPHHSQQKQLYHSIFKSLGTG